MKPRPFTPAAPAIAASAVLALGACQSYERQPLDPAATREAWLARSPSDESVLAFAEALGRGADAAAPFDPGDGLTLGEAEPVALVFNPDLRVARLEAGVTRASAAHAGLWEDPVVGVDLERIVGGVADPWVVGATLGITVPLSGRLAAEKARAGAELGATLQRLAAREWATRAALRELWIEWSAQRLRAELATELVGQLGEVVSLASQQERAGALTRIEARLFRVELVARETEAVAAGARLRELELQLRSVLGLAPEADVTLVPTLHFEPRAADGAAVLLALEETNPELASVRSEYEIAEQELRLEVRGQYPDLTIGPGYGTDQGDDRVLLGVSAPIPLWNRNQRGVAEAAARRELARGRFEAAYESLASRLAIALVRHEAGRAQREAIESGVGPLADEQEAEVRRVAELGRVEPLLFLETLNARYAAKSRLIDARVAEAVGAVRLDELIGPPLSESEPDPQPAGARP